MDWLAGLLGTFRVFGKDEDPVAQAGMWLFVAVGFTGFSLFTFVMAWYLSPRWYWCAGGIGCGLIGLGAVGAFLRAGRTPRPVLYRPKRDVPPTGRP